LWPAATIAAVQMTLIAWQQMDLFEAVEMDDKLPSKYFFIGDEAFTNTNQFLSPWPGE
jgi:hypothetical protein